MTNYMILDELTAVGAKIWRGMDVVDRGRYARMLAAGMPAAEVAQLINQCVYLHTAASILGRDDYEDVAESVNLDSDDLDPYDLADAVLDYWRKDETVAFVAGIDEDLIDLLESLKRELADAVAEQKFYQREVAAI